MNKLKELVNDVKTLPEKLLRSLAGYYIQKYKERLKAGFDTTKEEDELFATSIQYLKED